MKTEKNDEREERKEKELGIARKEVNSRERDRHGGKAGSYGE